jgi:hypothetical protein
MSEQHKEIMREAIAYYFLYRNKSPILNSRERSSNYFSDVAIRVAQSLPLGFLTNGLHFR